MKLVLDTDVIVAGLRSSNGASRELLRLLYHNQFQAVASVSMILEYEAVLTRPKNLAASGLSEQEVIRFLDSMLLFIIEVKSFFLWRPLLRDPGDEHVLEAAINSQADAIVTFNHRHFRNATERFSIDLIKPAEALRRVRSNI